LPVAERITQEVLSLPLFGTLKEDDIHRICDIIEFFHKSHFSTTQRLKLNVSDAKLTEANQVNVLSTEDALFYS
jgi:hypothetical protein